MDGRIQGLELFELELISALKGAEQIQLSDNVTPEGLNFLVTEKFL